MMKKVLLRYNTENDGSGLFWRVLVDGIEHLTDRVEVNVKSETSSDKLPDGRLKFHVSCNCDNIKISRALIVLS